MVDFEDNGEFSRQLLKWHRRLDSRELPWKERSDAYAIWLSEIIMQQTRVEQGTPYYLRFLAAFPTVQHLAKATEDQVMKLWEGLGYYSRARNLHSTAQYITTKLKGVFPKDYAGLLQLKGIGPYTAAAISSFAYGEPKAVVDGNVYRFLSRLYAIATPIDSTKGKKEFQRLADSLLNAKKAGEHNQAIMDFGALICKAKKAQCGTCPYQARCIAHKEGKEYHYPIKEKKVTIKKRYFFYLIASSQKTVLIHKRTEKDIWHSLYQFPLMEFNTPPEQEEIIERLSNFFGSREYLLTSQSSSIKHVLSHQHIYVTFLHITIPKWEGLDKKYLKLHLKQLADYAFPRIIERYLQDIK